MTMDAMVKITVKNVYQRSQSIFLDIPSESTILELKERLEEHVEAPPKHQRLIFGGKVCDNTQKLAEILKRMEAHEVYTFHVLVSNPDNLKPPSAEASSKSPEPTAPAPREVVPPPPAPTTTPTAMFSIPTPPTPSLFPFPPSFTPQAPTEPPQTPPCTPGMPEVQTVQLQHYLAQQETLLLMQIQFLRHIQECQQLFGHQQGSTESHFANVTTFTTRTYTVYTENANAAAQPADVPPNPWTRRFQAVRAVVMLLDFKLAVKMIVMMYIIGQDLPWSRLYLLIGISCFIYLYLTGILNKIYDILKGNNPDAPTPIPNAENNNEFEVPNIPTTPTAPFLTIPVEGGWWKDLQIFFMGLFVSLLPSWRPQATPDAEPVVDAPVQDVLVAQD
ncbi:hypothetical protein THRCLA_00026 [Thraustotheca clavata]|uniref:Ubiquitin-like domain-containing protein n=1 Tax=Thraustotheca clavata TaxID=74557 RepID=A0A1W0ACP0_9STRA|nr:hypothetical protein THRCLA_00026 [Thraustotheca clavata]